MSKRMCILGECMLEVSADPLQASAVGAGLSYGGDTLNTAVYFARLGGSVDYLTALGDDPLSSWMLECWQTEGVSCDLVQRIPRAAPGLYLIQLDEEGERSFVYWREQSAARRLLGDQHQVATLLSEAANRAEIFYLSGITLALMSSESRRALFEFAKAFRSRDGLIAFDSNHRPALWGDDDTARRVYEQMYSNSDIALSTADDEHALFGSSTASDIVSRLTQWGVVEVVVKNGSDGCTLLATGTKTEIPAAQVSVVDTTAAGDSFNAAYLHSRASGQDSLSAVVQGHRLASTVIGHKGAIIPAQAMSHL